MFQDDVDVVINFFLMGWLLQTDGFFRRFKWCSGAWNCTGDWNYRQHFIQNRWAFLQLNWKTERAVSWPASRRFSGRKSHSVCRYRAGRLHNTRLVGASVISNTGYSRPPKPQRGVSSRLVRRTKNSVQVWNDALMQIFYWSFQFPILCVKMKMSSGL